MKPTDATITAEQFVEQAEELFDRYRKSFGLSDYEFPLEDYQEQQCEFETKFQELLCEYRGHDIGPDQCGKPEHDLCYRCQKLTTEIEAERKELAR